MSSPQRKNFHLSENWADEIRAYVKKEREAGRQCFWDRTAYGILICSGKEYAVEARRDGIGRYFELKGENEIAELLTWYENEE